MKCGILGSLKNAIEEPHKQESQFFLDFSQPMPYPKWVPKEDPKESEDGRRIFIIDGKDFSTMEGLYEYIKRYTGTQPTNLAAFRDVLVGFGELEPPYIIIWRNSQKSSRELSDWKIILEIFEELQERKEGEFPMVELRLE
jgi:RNAse (barnase) inhibitor barstar